MASVISSYYVPNTSWQFPSKPEIEENCTDPLVLLTGAIEDLERAIEGRQRNILLTPSKILAPIFEEWEKILENSDHLDYLKQLQWAVIDYTALVKKLLESDGSRRTTELQELEAELSKFKNKSLPQTEEPGFLSRLFFEQRDLNGIARQFQKELRSFQIKPQDNPNALAALRGKVKNQLLADEKAEEGISLLKKGIFLTLFFLAQVSQVAQKPSLKTVYQKRVDEALRQEGDGHLDREAAFVGTVLNDKRENICKMSPFAFHKLTSRYPETRDFLLTTCSSHLKAHENIGDDYRAYRSLPRLLAPSEWQKAFLATFEEQREKTPMDFLDELAVKMETIPHPTPFSLTPPLPKSHPINGTAANIWIESHCTPEGREIAGKIVKAIRHVPHAVFEEALAESVEDFNNKLASQNNKDYTIVIDSVKKSSYWVTRLALKYLRYLPLRIVSVKDRFPIDSEFAMFDDAAYSGGHLAEIIGRYLRPKISNSSVFLVVPFITNPFPEHFKSFKEPEITIVKYRKMASLLEAAGTDEDRLELTFGRSDLYRSSTYFDHKIADFLSFCCARIGSEGKRLWQAMYKPDRPCSDPKELFPFLPNPIPPYRL